MKSALPYLVALLLIAVAGHWLVDPAPPKKIIISISKQDANFQAFAQLYKVLIRQDGVELEMRKSEGSQQSLGTLGGNGASADMAFLEDAPIAFSRHLYELRSHIELVRSRLQ